LRKSTGALGESDWEGLQARRVEAQELRMSGDDEKAMQILREVVRNMRTVFDPDSP